MVGRWCTVTVVDGQGRRHSIDVQAESTFDAAHLYVVHAKADAPYAPPPVPTRATVFEVVVNGQIHHVQGEKLQRWIEQRRQELKRPKGMLFNQRPALD